MALAVLVAFVMGGIILPYTHIRINFGLPSSEAEGGPLGVTPGTPVKLGEEEHYARAAQIASQSVVNIDMRRRVRVPTSIFDEDWISPHYQWAGSEGSGVIIDKSGDILTNEHVVGAVNENNRAITVTLMDGRKFDGTVVGSDHTTDVALVHINGTNLPVAEMGTVRGLTPGQMTVAIGNPFGFRFTVTHGVVSALDRPVSVEEEGRTYERLIQTDCAINPGNSGGALVNMTGQVIGINTVVLSGAQGIGFAIPIDTALAVAAELKKYGKVKRPWIGAVVVTNTPNIASYNNLPDVKGAIVSRIYSEGPAASAGLQPRDIITSIDGTPIHSAEDYKDAEKHLKIGQRVKIIVRREDETGTTTVTVGETP
jgi:S1-C subfamily serine protease